MSGLQPHDAKSMLIDEEQECGRLQIDNVGTHNSVHYSLNVLKCSSGCAVIYCVPVQPVGSNVAQLPHHWYYTVITLLLLRPCMWLWLTRIGSCGHVCICENTQTPPLRGLQHCSFIPLWPTCRRRQWQTPQWCKPTALLKTHSGCNSRAGRTRAVTANTPPILDITL